MTKDELEQQVKDLAAANEALVRQFDNLSLAYLAIRTNRNEEELARCWARLGRLEERIAKTDRRVDAASNAYQQLVSKK